MGERESSMEGMGELMHTIKERVEYFIKDFYYMVPVIIIAILSFGFVITHTCISMDTLSDYRYFDGTELLAQKRFTMFFFNKIFHIMEFNPFFIDFIAVLFLIISAITFCIVMQKASNGKISKICYTIFSCLFISYPLINEIFIYTPAGLSIALGYFGTAISILFLQHFFEKEKWIYAISATIIMMFAISTYESFAAVFLCAMCIVFVLNSLFSEDKISFKTTAINMIKWLISLVTAIILSQAIAVLIMNINNIEQSYEAAKEIMYKTRGFGTAINNLIDSITYLYVLKGLYYLPIAILLISVVLNSILAIANAIKCKSFTIYLLFLGTGLSLIALSILQGDASPYRACQVFALYTAFTFMLFTNSIINLSINKVIKTIVVIVMFMLAFYQSKDLHKWFYLNYLRYESEKQELIAVANELNSKHDTTKPVYFVATFSMPVSVKDQVYMNTDDERYKFIHSITSNMKTEYYWTVNNRITQASVFPYFYWGWQAFDESRNGNI